jgi:UrcA family protein
MVRAVTQSPIEASLLAFTHQKDVSMTTLRKWMSSLALATVVSVTTFSNAVAADRSATATVKTWDLDLANPADAQTLYGRVRDAAEGICRAEAKRHWRSTRMRAPAGWQERCVSDSVDAAVRNVASPLLAALHD